MNHTGTNNSYIFFYDITSDKLRRKIEKTLCDYGVRIQYSVFSVTVPNKSYRRLIIELSQLVTRHPSLCESMDSLFSVRVRSDEAVESIYGNCPPSGEKYLLIG